MPVYDYKCTEHGIFYDLATVEDCGKLAACPVCAKLSPRIIVIPPQILEMAREKKSAMERNEKSQHVPALSNQDSRAENAEKLKRGCGCQHLKKPSKLIYTAEGNKMFPSMRPWMISH